MNELSKLGLAIKAARESLGLSMRQLAEAADLSPSTISLIESGQRDATFSTIVSISRALAVKPSILLDLAAGLDDDVANSQKWRANIQENRGSLDALSKSLNEKLKIVLANVGAKSETQF
jgi:transcriptional regulator with XRE-family HTH domain